MLSKTQIQELSARHSIDEFTIIREYLQLVLLTELYAKKESTGVYFKGGTAIHLLMNGGRFSEDLDFTATLSKKELQAVFFDMVKKASRTIPGVTIKKSEANPNSLAGIVSYQPEGTKYPLNVHVEFSLRDKPLTKRETVLETIFPLASSPVIRHLDWSEILAEKIRALMTRSRGRDLYDLWFLLSKEIPLNWKMANDKMKLYTKGVRQEDIMKRVRDFDEKQLKSDLQTFLSVPDRKMIPHLKGALLKKLKILQCETA